MSTTMFRNLAALTVFAVQLLDASGQPGLPISSPAALMPSGPMVYLEVRDLKGLLRWWDGSPEKAAWLKSANLEQFRNSKIFLKLASRLEQFSRSAGFDIDYARLAACAGLRSALALYNPGETEFLFLTELPAIQRQATDLLKLRGRFLARQSAGAGYYLNQEGGRTVCFAEAGPYLLLATSEELLRAALALYQRSGGSGQALADDPSWRQLNPGEVFHHARAYLDFSLLSRNANFRHEWLFGNLTQLGGYRAVRLDLEWGTQRIVETRNFLRTDSPPALPALDTGLIERFVPNGFEYVDATTDTGSFEQIAARVEQAIVNPLPDSARSLSRQRSLYDAYHGYQPSRPRSSFEKQSNEPEIPADPTPEAESTAPSRHLLGLLSSGPPRGVVEIGRSQRLDPDFLVGFQRAFVLQGNPSALTRQQLRDWITAEFKELYTAGSLGASWQSKVLAGIEYDLLSTPALRAATGIIGGAAVVATPPEFMDRIIQTYQANLPPRFALSGGGLNAYASLNFSAARGGFARLMSVLDHQELANRGQGSPPLFFSQNLAGLLECLSALERITLERRQSGSLTEETVVYWLAEQPAVKQAGNGNPARY